MKVWDKGVAVDVTDTPVVHDLNRAEKFDALPANTVAVPIVVPSADGKSSVIALADPKTLKNKVEVVKFPDVVISKTNLTIGAGVNGHFVACPGVKKGDFLVASVKSVTNGWAAFNPYCPLDDQLAVLMMGPALVSGAFTCTLQLIALR